MPDIVSSGAWHACSIADVLRALDSRQDGLTEDEAARRLEADGPNQVSAPEPFSALRLLLAQFTSIVVLLLIVAALVSAFLGDWVDTGAIVAVILINASLGFGIELRARRAMEALGQLGAAHASVVRDGRLRAVDARTLVTGDIVELTLGQTVPADGRVLTAIDLRANEAALTGESLPVGKHVDAALAPDVPLADRVTMIYQGTTITAGTGTIVVTATGDRTEVGHVGRLTRSIAEEPTPLERRLDTLGRHLVWLSLVVAVLVALLGRAHGHGWPLMIETAIALAVAAVPEGLPAIVTIALAVGLRRMARRRALVRRLPAVETLGSTTVVCTDKTRTLTSGEMAVVRLWSGGVEVRIDPSAPARLARGGGAARLLEVAMRASRTHASGGARATGDPVDRAIVEAARAAGVAGQDLQAVGRVPFSSERKFMAVFFADGARVTTCVKGAPRRVVDMSDWMRTADGSLQLLDHERRDHLVQVNERLAADGLRMLAVASGEVGQAAEPALRALVFEGFVGLLDPPARGVKGAIAQLHRAGLRTVMLTGDQRATAEAVGRDLGVLRPGDQAVDSRELRTLTPEALRARLPRIGTFSRVSPEDKLTIVRAFQQEREIVAMLGDGVNDAPALRQADVGVAMGHRGTDVAKDAAAIVLQDDRFETIVAAVEEGRIVFDNIRKCVFYLFSCNLAEVLILLAASLGGLPMPLMPLQILWLNLVTDSFPALALAMEPGDRDVMERPPRDPREAILSSRFLTSVALHALLITASTLAAFVWALGHTPASATTVAFMTLALAQTFHLGNARSPRAVLHPRAAFANLYAVGAVALSVLLQLASLYYSPLAQVLQTSPLSREAWLIVLGFAAVPAVVGQLWRRRPVNEHDEAASAH